MTAGPPVIIRPLFAVLPLLVHTAGQCCFEPGGLLSDMSRGSGAALMSHSPTDCRTGKRAQFGLSPIELTLAIAIAAIPAGVCLPSHQRHVVMPRRNSDTDQSNGFTVIELLIVMTIAVVLIAIGMPSFVEFTRETRAGSAMTSLTGDIQLARSEAVKRNSRVLFCARASATSSSCSGAPSASAWMNGWLVCYDRNADGACDASTAADPNPIRVQGALSAPLSVSGPAATLIFFPIGNASTGATFTLTGSTATTRTATIALSGSIVTAKTQGGSYS